MCASGVPECWSEVHPLSLHSDGISLVTTETILVLLALSRAVWQPVAFCHLSPRLPCACSFLRAHLCEGISALEDGSMPCSVRADVSRPLAYTHLSQSLFMAVMVVCVLRKRWIHLSIRTRCCGEVRLVKNFPYLSAPMCRPAVQIWELPVGFVPG